MLWNCWFYWNGSMSLGEENCRLQDHLIINILRRNQSIPQIFCIEIVTSERKLLRVLILVRHVQPRPNLPRSAKAVLGFIWGVQQAQIRSRWKLIYLPQKIFKFSNLLFFSSLGPRFIFWQLCWIKCLFKNICEWRRC